MSAARGRRTAIGLLLVLLAVAVVITLAPAAPGAVRLGGVSVLWWYVGALAPLVATVVAITWLVRRAE